MQKCEKTEDVLESTNCVVSLQRSYSATQSEILKREGQWNATQEVLAKNNKILSVLKVSARNLHNILASIQTDGQVVIDDNPQNNLKRVKEYLLSLEDLVATLERKTGD
nr:unnamed protein product [Spirometra erinaceieuropaei]